MSMAPNDTHSVVITVLTDLTLAICVRDTCCFDLAEAVALRDALNIVAVRNLPEEEYHEKAIVLIRGSVDLARTRDPKTMARCPLTQKLSSALRQLAICEPRKS